MSRGIKLTSQEDLENAEPKLNILFVVAIVVAVVLGAMAGSGMLMLLVVFLIAAWCIKGEYLKWKVRDFRKMEFWKPENLTEEEIEQKVSDALLTKGIQTFLENGQLVFKKGSILYGFENVAKDVFRLEWGYTLGKALFTFSYINNYKTVREDTASIVYAIQNLGGNKEETV